MGPEYNQTPVTVCQEKPDITFVGKIITEVSDQEAIQ
jgi:hypothetical protein